MGVFSCHSYYFLDIGRAIKSCWTDQIVLHTPGPEEDTDFYKRMAGLSAKDLLKWRWLCATGVYHAAGNTLSVAIMKEIVSVGQGAEEFLCKHANVWGATDRYFDRCAAGLGIKETELRLEKVKRRQCEAVGGSASRGGAVGSASPPAAAWELRQLQQVCALAARCALYHYCTVLSELCVAVGARLCCV